MLVHPLSVIAASPAATPGDPYQIFARARAYWAAQRYPHYVDYDTVVAVRDARGERLERYNSAYDADDNSVWVDPVSDYERVHPASGRGVKFCMGQCVAAPDPAPDQDFIGVPILAPNYSFTIGPLTVATESTPSPEAIVEQVREAFHDPNPHPTTTPASALPEIASVVAFRKDYRITLAGEEPIDGTGTYHLVLVPFRADGEHRLRDIWVQTNTYATVRVRTALNFVDGPGTQLPWTINFADVSGARFISDETADGTYAYARRRYDYVAIRFENIRVRQTSLPIRPVPPSAFLILNEPRV